MTSPSNQRRSRWRIVVEVGIVAAVWIAVSQWQTRDLPRSSETLRLGEHLRTLAGEPFQWQSSASRTLVFAFAPWCGVCKFSSGNLNWLVQTLGVERVRIVPIAFDYDAPQAVQEYVAEHPFPTPVVLGDEATQAALNVTAYPTYFVLDEELKVRHTSVGYATFLGMLARALW